MPDRNLRVLVVWEPVLPGDTDAPSTGDLARVSDHRAAQFWDRDHLVEKQFKSMVDVQSIAVVGKRELIAGPTLWDCVLVFARGQKWERGSLAPRFAGAPAMRVAEELKEALGSAGPVASR